MRLALIGIVVTSAAFAGERAKIVREVPRHDVALLADCPADDAAAIKHEIAVAISMGAPTYNAGDFEGCYRVYSNTAVALDAQQKGCAGVRKALIAGVERAKKLKTFDEKAWAMRDAFDGVVDVIERSAAATPELPAVERHVPKFPLRMLDDCPAQARASVAKAIEEAIDVGAPLYNEGKIDGCARVYLGTAMELQSLSGCQSVKRALETAATQARGAKDAATRAWMFRDVFDGLLDVLARKKKAASEEI